MSATEGLLKEGYFLYLQIAIPTIDINIHPNPKPKLSLTTNIRYMLFGVRLLKYSLGQFNVAPVLDFERDANLDALTNTK